MTDRVRLPLVPVTVTTKVPPALPVQDNVDVAEVVVVDKATLVGEKVQVSPVTGETASDNVTVPVKPLTPETVIVEVPGVP